MAILKKQDERLASLPFPLKNVAQVQSADPTEMLNSDLIGKGGSNNKTSVIRPSSEFALGSVGQVRMLATRTTPCISIAEDAQYITLAMLYAGDRYTYRKEKNIQFIEPGSIHVCQRTGGTADIGYFSGIICEIDQSRLERTMRAIGGEAFKWNEQRSYVLKRSQSNEGSNTHEHIWSLFAFIDQLLGESTYLAEGLGLDEQIYRLLSASLFRAEGAFEEIEKRWTVATNNWTNRMNDLVDYIRQNTHLNLTLTDLEEQSHYSGRHLQNLFKEKFDCTPMQFVKRERLSSALERLQTAGLDDTVTTIARDMGYRYTSSFTCDFQKEFGVAPSAVLRASQGGGGGGM